MAAFELLCRTEGIIPAIESAHALAGAVRLAPELGPDATILVCLSGRGDKDVETAGEWFGLLADQRCGRRMRRRERVMLGRVREGAGRGAGRAGRLPAGRLPDRGRRDRRGPGAGRVRGGPDRGRLPLLRPGDGRPGHPAGQRDRAGRRRARRRRAAHRRAAVAETGVPVRRDDLLEPGRALRRYRGTERGVAASPATSPRPAGPG